MKRNRHFKILASVLVLMQIFSATASALTSGGACAIDAATGDVLFEYNADKPLVPASMTKFLTLYITYDKMNEGKFDKNTMITCTQTAANFSRAPGASNIPLNAGTAYSVHELIGAAAVPSSCSAAYLLGEFIAGSEAEFVKLMNEYVGKLGLEAYYTDSSGVSFYNVITPRSMAKLGARFINDYPDILNYTSSQYINFRGKNYKNTNNLLPGRTYAYPGADGLKTGTNGPAGSCLTATAMRDGIRVVAVTMRSSGVNRYTDMHTILNSAFAKAKTLQVKIQPDTTRMFIDGAEIPSMYSTGETQNTVILAEHLAGYGFDVTYNHEERTVYITKNAQKTITPVNCAEYDSFTSPTIRNSNLKVIIKDGDKSLEISTVYDLSGYAAIPVLELTELYDYTWSTPDMSGYFVSRKEI